MSVQATIRNVDLHVHTNDRSPCGTTSEEQQIRAAIAAGLHAIFFTDHHRLVPEERLNELNQTFAPFHIFGGIEVTSQEEDFVILGLQDPRLESPDWLYPDLHAFVRSNGGFMALAHPFRFRDHIAVDCGLYRPDAIEIHSPNTPVAKQDHIRDLAQKWSIPTLSNSDAHSCERLGMYYNILNEPAADEASIINLLRSGRFTLSCSVGDAK